MNNNQVILNKNLKAMQKRYPEMAQYIRKYIDAEQGTSYAFIDKSVNEEIIAGVRTNGRDWYFNSRYNAQLAAKVWADQYRDVNFQAVFILLGFANGMYIRKLLNITQNTNSFLVYEPDKELFIQIVQNIDISDLIKDENIYISVQDINDNLAVEFIILRIDYSNMRLMEYVTLPNYENLYQVQWRDLMRKIKDRVETIVINRNTQISFKHEFIVNMFMNYRDMISQYTINQLKKNLSDVDFDNIPAIIVAAGPSLDKNIMELKRAKGKAFIIAVDTALNSLAKVDIIPDIAVTVDPHKPLTLFQNPKMKKVPMVVSQYSSSSVISALSAKKFYMGEHDYIAYMFDKYGKEAPAQLESGGSVANNAFSLAQYIGFRTIILVGQDLAYTNNKKHTTDAYGGDNSFIKEEEKSKDYMLVDAIDGGKVWTKGNMKLYLAWFENQIARFPELKVIDATEGGALKKGSVVQALKQTIDMECRAEYNFFAKINSINSLLNKEEQQKVFDEFVNMPQEIDRGKQKIQDGIELYDKMLDLHNRGKNGTKEYIKVLKDIEKVNYYTDNTPLLTLASVYNAKENYEVQAEVYDVQQNEKDEMKNIHHLGVKMLKSYITALDKMKEDVRYLDGREIIQLLMKRLRWVLCLVDYTTYEYRRYHFQNGVSFYKNLIAHLTNAMDIVRNNRAIMVKNQVKFELDIFDDILCEMMDAQLNQDNILLIDLLQLKLKPVIKEWIINAMNQGITYLEDYEENNKEYGMIYNDGLCAQLEKCRIKYDDYIIENTSYHMPTLKRQLGNNKVFYFHSNENPRIEADYIWDSIQIDPEQDIVVLGFGLGYMALSFYRMKFDVDIYFYETDINILKLAFYYINLEPILKEKKVHIIYDPDLSKFSAKIREGNNTVYFHRPSVMNITDEKLRLVVEEMEMIYNSSREQKAMLDRNISRNLVEVTGMLDDENDKIEGKTWVYVAGGPSLDDDMGELRKNALSNDVIVACAGTVYKKLLHANIIPDYVIVSDAKHSIRNQINETDCGKSILLYLSTVDKSVVDCWKGEKRIVLQKGMKKAELFAQQNGHILIETGGSVSTIAIDIGIKMGAAKIICVGLDLAFIGDKTHAADTHAKHITDTSNMRKVKSIEGKMIPTYKNLDSYRRWIEHHIRNVKNIEFINASGGAYIEGMKHIRLKDL